MKSFILMTILIFGTLSCSEDQFMFSQEIGANIAHIEPPGPTSLHLVNQVQDNFSITFWSMTGYEFKDLDIPPGESNFFLMTNDMPEGYHNIKVTVIFASSTGSFSISDKVNFIPGGVTVITISGCEACDDGYQISSKW